MTAFTCRSCSFTTFTAEDAPVPDDRRCRLCSWIVSSMEVEDRLAFARAYWRGRSNYDLVHTETTRERLLIRDLGGGMTVTNDAEAVVRELTMAGLLWPGRRLLYYDSAGSCDEILHDGEGHCAGFWPGQGSAADGKVAG
jgi:hypothetical protein